MQVSLIALLSMFVLAGCATAPVTHAPLAIERPKVPGIYHKVEKGQTLWRIAKHYNVAIEDIVKINRIPDAAQISVGQFLFIPSPAVVYPKVKDGVGVKPNAPEKEDFIWPVKGKVASFYGSKKDGVSNKGIDICAREGADVVASRPGKVIFYDPKLRGYGHTVIIDHFDGFSTLYAHNSSVLVKAGDMVKQGQLITRAGSSGRAQKSCLHFEIRKGDKPQNPFYYLPR